MYTASSVSLKFLLTQDLFFYRVTAENEYGVGIPYETPDPVKATQEPGPVQRLEVVETTKSSCTITWQKPLHDGGSRLTGYTVELSLKEAEDWSEVGDVKLQSYKVLF